MTGTTAAVLAGCQDTAETTVPISIEAVAVSKSLYMRAETVDVTVTVSNHTAEDRRVFAGLSVIDVDGTVWDGTNWEPATNPDSRSIPAGETVETTLTWASSHNAPPGTYHTVVALWDRYTETTFETRLTDNRQQNAFIISEATPNGCPIRGDYVYL